MERSRWNRGPEILYDYECTKDNATTGVKGCGRTFAADIDGIHVIACYQKGGDLDRDEPIHVSLGPRDPHSVSTNSGNRSRIAGRLWVVGNGQNADRAVLTFGTISNPGNRDPDYVSRRSGQTLTYHESSDKVEAVLDSLAWLGRDKEGVDKFCKGYISARSTLATTEFVLFPFLPNELQSMIWARAACTPRFIEIVQQTGITHQPTPSEPVSEQIQPFFRVSSSSRRYRPVFHVSQASRKEAFKQHDELNLDFLLVGSNEEKMMFNARADIPYFGSGCTLQALAQFCRIAHFRGQRFFRVAISASNKFISNAETVIDIMLRNEDKDSDDNEDDEDDEDIGNIGDNGDGEEYELYASAIDMVRGINTSGNNRKQTLHISKGSRDSGDIQFFPGLSGTEDIFVVVDSHLDKMQSNQVDYDTTFRYVDSDAGINRLDRGVLQLEQSLATLYSRGVPHWQQPKANPWIGSSVPAFHFVSLATARPEEYGHTINYRRSVIMSPEVFESAGLLRGDVKDVIEAITGCLLSFPIALIEADPIEEWEGDMMSSEKRLEIGIAGPTKTAVQGVITILEKLVARRGTWYFEQYLSTPYSDLDFSSVDMMLWIEKMLAIDCNTANRSKLWPSQYMVRTGWQYDGVKVQHLYDLPIHAQLRAVRVVPENKPDPLVNLVTAIDNLGPGTTPARINRWHPITFDGMTGFDEIEKHRWWLSAAYYDHNRSALRLNAGLNTD